VNLVVAEGPDSVPLEVVNLEHLKVSKNCVHTDFRVRPTLVMLTGYYKCGYNLKLFNG
jgi:hypothetical protein